MKGTGYSGLRASIKGDSLRNGRKISCALALIFAGCSPAVKNASPDIPIIYITAESSHAAWKSENRTPIVEEPANAENGAVDKIEILPTSITFDRMGNTFFAYVVTPIEDGWSDLYDARTSFFSRRSGEDWQPIAQCADVRMCDTTEARKGRKPVLAIKAEFIPGPQDKLLPSNLEYVFSRSELDSRNGKKP